MSVALNFYVVQNIRDAYLLESFVHVFGCGYYSLVEKSGIGTFAVSNFSNIVDNIIPLFEQYPILGAKAKDFEDFKQASILIKSKAHLTKRYKCNKKRKTATNTFKPLHLRFYTDYLHTCFRSTLKHVLIFFLNDEVETKSRRSRDEVETKSLSFEIFFLLIKKLTVFKLNRTIIN